MKIGICTGGGDCPGLNAAIRTAVKLYAADMGLKHMASKIVLTVLWKVLQLESFLWKLMMSRIF